IALEGALKLKEISYIHAEGYAGGEMKHGPIALIADRLPVVALVPRDGSYDRMLGNVEEVRARDGQIIAIAHAGDRAIAAKAQHVLAGAGSGKTRVIAYRIAWLTGGQSLSPRNLLAVTFTNKAAKEMARRVEALLLPAGIRAPMIATFHSMCVRVLRQHGRHIGLP